MPRSSKTPTLDRIPGEGTVVAGRYRLVEEIASGGMGVVMRASDESMGRDVGLKLLHAHIAGEEGFIDRFEREAKVATLFNHPNVTRVYDFGKTDDGLLYLVMELLDGEDLKSVIRRTHRMNAGRTTEIILQTLDGLAEAHSMGVVHRDLKPSNIFLSRTRRGKEVVKILDFGVAKLLDSTSTTLTQTGMVTGTPSYIAPERLIGDADSFSVDVYAVGLIMLEMLLGRKVFDGETMAQCLLMQLKKPVPLPRKLAETPLGEVIRKATAKHPGDRYRDAEEMLDALEVAAESTPADLRLSPADSPPRPEDTSSSILDQIMSGKGDIGLLRDMPQHDSDFTDIDSLDEESAGELLRTLLIDEEDIEYIEETAELPGSDVQNDRTERFEERRTTPHTAVTREEPGPDDDEKRTKSYDAIPAEVDAAGRDERDSTWGGRAVPSSSSSDEPEETIEPEPRDYGTAPTAIVPDLTSKEPTDTYDVDLEDEGSGGSRNLVAGISVATLLVVTGVFVWLIVDTDSSTDAGETVNNEQGAAASEAEQVDEGAPEPAGADDAAAGDTGVQSEIEVTIESKPDGASVRDGERVLGTTPLTASLATDDLPRTLQIEKKDYKSETFELDEAPAEPIMIELEREKAVAPPKPRVEPTSRTREPRRTRRPRRDDTAAKRESDKPDKDESVQDVDSVLDKYLD